MNNKNYLILSVLLLISFSGNSQVFTGGGGGGEDFDFEVLGNDPSISSKWSVTGLLTAAYHEQFIIPTLHLFSSYNIIDGLDVRGSANLGFPISVGNFMQEDFPEAAKSYRRLFQNHYLLFSGRLFSREVTRKTNILIKETSNGRVSTAYMVRAKMKHLRSFNVLAGADAITSRIQRDQQVLQPANGVDSVNGAEIMYRAINFDNNNLRLGFEFRWQTFIAKKLDGEVQPEYQDFSLYAVALLPVVQKPDVITYAEDLSAWDFDAMQFIHRTNTGYIEPEYNPLGFLVGVQATNARSKSRSRSNFRLEGGFLPGFKYEEEASNLYVGLSFSIGIGSDLLRQWYKKYPKESDQE